MSFHYHDPDLLVITDADGDELYATRYLDGVIAIRLDVKSAERPSSGHHPVIMIGGADRRELGEFIAQRPPQGGGKGPGFRL